MIPSAISRRISSDLEISIEAAAASSASIPAWDMRSEMVTLGPVMDRILHQTHCTDRTHCDPVPVVQEWGWAPQLPKVFSSKPDALHPDWPVLQGFAFASPSDWFVEAVKAAVLDAVIYGQRLIINMPPHQGRSPWTGQ